MKRNFTISTGFFSIRTIKMLIAAALFPALFFISCYEWRNIFQPDIVDINSSFDVWLSAQDDGNPDNDWTNPDNHDYGLFGVMLPVGWTVEDNIQYYVVTTEPGYDNDGFLVYDADHSATLQDSLPAPFGYYWWGAKSENEVSMIYFDSLYLEPNITVTEQTGNFFLRYAIGDVNYWDRNPADDVSDPIPITVSDFAGIDEVINESNISLYPNPVSNKLNVSFNHFEGNEAEVYILDVSGKVVLSQQVYNQNNSIYVGDLSHGFYFVKIQNGESSSVQKILVN